MRWTCYYRQGSTTRHENLPDRPAEVERSCPFPMNFTEPNVIPAEELRISSGVMRAITHPLRMQLLEFIDQNEMINVNRIYSSLDLEQSITSQHLRILRQAGLVETERRGKYIHYRICRGKIERTIAAIRAYEAEVQKSIHKRWQTRTR